MDRGEDHPPRQSTAAIVLTYFPDVRILGELISAVGPQVSTVLIVDNGSYWDRQEFLSRVEPEAQLKLEFLQLESNEGVGAGHNHGIRWARAQGFDHVLILDQDSIPAPDMVSELGSALKRLATDAVKVATVAPRYVDRYSGVVVPFYRLGGLRIRPVRCEGVGRDELIETDFVISSGALIPLAVLNDVGEMDESLFIDHVDTEWAFRARAAGYLTFGVCSAIMEHSLGTDTIRVWLGRWMHVPLHGPERHYYAFRNGIALMRRPYVPRRWILIDTIRMTKMVVFFTLFAPSRLRRLALMARGIRDGMRGITGKLR